jgi:hypothetical protein
LAGGFRFGYRFDFAAKFGVIRNLFHTMLRRTTRETIVW